MDLLGWLLAPRRRAERALVAVVAECYVRGVSTRRVEGLMATLGIQSLSKSQVSELAKTLDGEVAAFRARPLDAGPYPYVWVDALAVKCREQGRIVNVACVLATGVNADGHREILGVDVLTSEDGAGWTAFLRDLVARGLAGVELEAGQAPLPPGRVRRPGGGRKPAARQDPALVPALLALVEPDERGDPMSPLRWTTKSLRHLAEELTRQGHPVSAPTVGRLLKREGFSLQANVKTLEGAQHPDRDAQFRYLNEQVKNHQADGEPVISVDTKKREQLGRVPMAGREWRPRGQPVKVEDHHCFHRPGGRA